MAVRQRILLAIVAIGVLIAVPIAGRTQLPSPSPTPASTVEQPPRGKPMVMPVPDAKWSPASKGSLKSAALPESVPQPAPASQALPGAPLASTTVPTSVLPLESHAAPNANAAPPGTPLPDPNATIENSAPSSFTPPSAAPLFVPRDIGQNTLTQPGAPAPTGDARAGKPSPTVAPAMGAQAPSLQVEKIGPATIPVGKPIAYEIVIRNNGTCPVQNVRIEDHLPAAAKLLSAEPRPESSGETLAWSLGTLEPGAERRIRLEIQPAGEGEIVSQAVATFSAHCGLRTQVTKPNVAIRVSGPESIRVGDPATFQIQVANTGTGAAQQVVLHANLPEGFWHEKGNKIDADLGVVAPGETRTIPLTLNAIRSGKHVNDFSITGEDGVQAASQAVVQITEPVLTLRATGPRRRYLHREAHIELEVANVGTGAATNVRVGNLLPEGLDFVSASEGGTFDPATRTVVWHVPTRAPGHRQTFALKTTPKALGEQVSRAVARDERGAETRVESAVFVEGLTALLLEVVDVDDPVAIGSDMRYEIRVLNQGTAANTNVQLLVALPPGTTVKNVNSPVAHRANSQQIAFDPLPTLAARADVVYRISLASQQAGDQRLKVQLSSDQVKTPINKEESTHVYADSDEVITKTSHETAKPEAPRSPNSN
jgi:uncharacterized repeat protein (TIGR01451 family)